MKKEKTDMKLEEILNNTPGTEELLKKLDLTDVPDLENDPKFVSEYLKGQITEDILITMEEKRINKNQLAKKLGKSRQYINKILNETANFTLDSLAKITCALNCKIEVRILNKRNYLENSSAYKKESEIITDNIVQIARPLKKNNSSITGDKYENFIFAS